MKVEKKFLFRRTSPEESQSLGLNDQHSPFSRLFPKYQKRKSKQTKFMDRSSSFAKEREDDSSCTFVQKKEE
ncbi:hypothetical protein DdX_10532 [Ditylenchus destructor]|uniref:Uncharacterized protein n=1 Tax=Ditylenchus destructor TaxID=166010 RepID=A0AAD4R580_9BILA|nr:hypothetical protein DdX_10532 [Ditylenchus destructor]